MSPDPATALQRHPLLRVPVPWVFVLAYLAGAGLHLLVPVRVGSPGLIRITGMIVFAIGGALAAWCFLLFRRVSTTTTPGETSSAFVTRGPYRVSRNPMYVSLTLLYLGEMGILGQVWPFVPLIVVLLYLHKIVIPIEEARLHESFGFAYERYRATVRRWL